MSNKKQSYSKSSASDLLISPVEAVREIELRRNNTELLQKVQDYLEGDIPRYFKGKQPVLYMARHVAAPNFEVLRFIELARPFGLPIILSQDPKDKFVSNNSLKRALGKMPIVRAVTADGREIIEHFTIIDFAKTQGRRFKNIRTNFDMPLIKFQNYLLNQVYPHEVKLVNDSAWIDRHHRGDLLEHYKKFLALLLIHGIMFESYVDEDELFVKDILRPAFNFIEKEIGVRPLICNLVDEELLHTRDWYSYPSVIYQYVEKFYTKHSLINKQ